MFRRLQRSIENLKRAALEKKFAYRVAGGIATGLLIGVLPKDSALPYLFGVFAILLPFSLLATAISAVIFSMVSPLLDPTWDQVGYEILSSSHFHSFGVWLETLPAVAWTRFNNTVVMGSLVCSTAAWLPCFGICLLGISILQATSKRNRASVSNPRATEIER